MSEFAFLHCSANPTFVWILHLMGLPTPVPVHVHARVKDKPRKAAKTQTLDPSERETPASAPKIPQNRQETICECVSR